MKHALVRVVLVSLALAVTLTAQAPAGRDDEFAQRQFASGLSFLQNKRYTEALKDFQAVVDSFPRSVVADDALLQIALYQLEIAQDHAAAQAATDRLLKDYPDADSAPMGYVVGGRLAIAKGHAPADVDAALASFERVPRLFPGADAVPAAGFYAGETLRIVRRTDDAVDRFNRVVLGYPRSIWAARATLSAAMALAQSDRAARAIEGLQRVREHFPGSPEAAMALNFNTIIYRLFVRLATQPAFAFSGRFVGAESLKLKDVVGIVVDASGQTFLGYNKGVAVFDAKAALARTIVADNPSAFFVDDRGRVVLIRRDQMTIAGGETSTLAVPPSPNGKIRQLEELPSAVVLSNGDRLVADPKGKAVLRFSAAGKFVGTFAPVNTERLALSRLEDVAMIDRETKGIVLVDRDGKTLSKLPSKGMGYELDNPVDVAFDSLGHLYVLDRGRPSVLIFGAKNRLITTLTVPEKEPGGLSKPQALALDGAGRLYVFDDRAQRIQVYQ